MRLLSSIAPARVDPPTPTLRSAALRALAAVFFVGALAHAASVVPSDAPYVRSLDGAWRFKIESPGGAKSRSPDADSTAAKPGTEKIIELPAPPKEPFHQPSYIEGKDWVDLAVPGNWEMAGHSPATYNQPDDASGFYRLWIDIPQSWAGRLVRLNFDGVQNGAEFWLNGQPVAVDEPSWGRENYHESGWTAFQVDLTPQVKFGEKNLLAVRVHKQTRSADLDSGDYFFLGGIYRTVTLFSVPRTHVADFAVQTRLLPGQRAEVKVLVDLAGTDAAALSMRIDGVPGSSTAAIQGGRASLTQIVAQPQLWSAESPRLYTLTLELKDARSQILETLTRRIGIREVTIKDSVLLLNGVPVKLAGVCRHDLSPTEGTAVGPALWRKDIALMKAANINAIRTSHYPYGSGFYDLCDEMGMYVIDELPYCWCPTDTPELQPAFEQRARETIRRDKNHPSILVWAIGNENKEGRNLRIVADLVKRLEPTRPRAVSWFDYTKCDTELSDSHYTAPKKIADSAAKARANGHPHIYLENPNTWDIRLAADPGAWERWGDVLQRVWDVCAKNDTIPGTFLWEWQDRAIVDKSPTKNYVFFPETGIQLQKIKGIVDAFRNPRPWYYDVKMVYSPIRVGDAVRATADKASFSVENRYSFTDLSALKLAWTLEQDGRAIASGDSRISRPPRSSGQAELALPAETLARADALRVEFIHADGNQVVAHRFRLRETPSSARIDPAAAAELPLPQFNLVTRVTERDPARWRRITRSAAQLTEVALEPASATRLAQVQSLTANVRRDATGPVLGRVQARFVDGEWQYQLEWTGAEADVQELGWSFQLPRDRERFSWDRAARWTVYPEGHSSRAHGTATPDTINVPITRVDRIDAFDFNSTKYDCNWASLTTAAGAGVRVEFSPQQRFHCRAGLTDDGQGSLLFVNQQVAPPDDISKSVVSDFYRKLKAGDTIEGRFRVGANHTLARD